MLVHEYDDERTLEEEESEDGGRNFSSELADLEKEGNMPLEELLAIYRYEASAGSSIDSSSGDLTDELPDMTLDKEEIAKDLLSGDYEEETQSSADDLTPSVTSHEATDFFPRTLRSNTISDGDKESECDEDGPSPEDSRKEIMVGAQYQAEVPLGLAHYKDGERVYEDEDELVWSPCVLSEHKVKGFLSEVLSRTTDDRNCFEKTATHVRDNEQALRELLKCNYNTREAVERHCSHVRSSKEKSPPWSEEECKNFEHALQMYDKNFHLIQKHKVTTRSVAECVAFYYMWKKSERFDVFVQQNRFGKKKFSSYPGVTDLMDRLVDEAEGLAVDSSSSVCSGSGGGGRLESATEQQLSLLNSITASDLTALSNSVATVCSPADVACLDSYSFPSMESLHRGSLNHDESLGFSANGGESDCLNMLDTGFYHSDLGQLGGVCVAKDCERPSKRLKLALPDSFMGDVSVGNLGVDFDARRTTTTHHHRITGAKMAVSVTDFGSLAGSGEPNGFLGAHARHHTPHAAALQSD
ncbi:mesoderm induction early response protein 3 isoform X2 [Gouania willdenowi]|uniref:Mesoderm induction early response 1, family member 3 b n=2 Tax=Gouania willdenowi TaxID=441366 RepID=A0A8C5G2L4_GOUWI|nr:mesoderm induction early response protein 3 isoform X2 [Gouania willdenowi]